MSPSSLPIRTLVFTVAVFTAATLGDAVAFAHARLDRAEPPTVEPVVPASVMRVWFTQALMRASSMVIVDQSGARVDLGDGRVDLDDPDRKVMLITVPELPAGVYTVYWSTLSADDGHTGCGAFPLGVGVAPPPPDQAAPEVGLAPGELRTWEIGGVRCATSD